VTVTPVRRRPLAVGPFARDPDSHDRRPPTAVVFVTDPEARPGPAVADRLRATYGLTSAEATVAVAVSRGTGLRAIAGDRGVALATVRTQLLRAYAKTGSQNQASLAGLVAQFGRAH
jgi:DNA-binding CsgD family transcriptional regulator